MHDDDLILLASPLQLIDQLNLFLSHSSFTFL